MAFTTISKVVLDDGIGAESPFYFYPEDISIVFNQPNVDAVEVAKAKVFNSNLLESIECNVLVGLKVFRDADDNVIGTERLEDSLIVLSCPPFNHKGGIFFNDPWQALIDLGVVNP